jgi:hypothetical protein
VELAWLVELWYCEKSYAGSLMCGCLAGLVLPNGKGMNGLRQGLLGLSLVLAVAAVVCAEPAAGVSPLVQSVTEIVQPVQLGQGATSAAPVPGTVLSPEVKSAGAAEPVAAAIPAAEVIKVSRLEPVDVARPLTLEERQLESRKADFLAFAGTKLQEMNRNHILSRERMRIEKRSDGKYLASFHQIDDSSMSCQVSRSPTKAAQYVAVLSYKERVYSAACGTPAECRQGNFTPVEVIPNRHIFVYTNGGWQ